MTGDSGEGPVEGEDFTEMVRRAGPCRLGRLHTEPGPNGMVYCEHGLSVFYCHEGCTGLPPLVPRCDECGRLKDEHSESEAMYCITRAIARASDRNVHITGP